MLIIFSEYYILLIYIYLFFFFWTLFYKVNFFNINLSFLFTETIMSKNIFKKLSFDFYIRVNFLILMLIVLFIVLIRGFSDTLWWSNLRLSNFNLSLIFMLVVINLVFLLLLTSLKFGNEVYKTDFFFSLINLSCFLPFIFLTNNLLVFFFFLEVCSCILFYNFVNSSNFYKDNEKKISIKLFSKTNEFLSMLFFQYWTAFFSSILFVFSIINFLYYFNTTEWAVINYLFYFYNVNISNVYYTQFLLLFISLNIAFLFKLGFSPIHFYKIEVYKGLSLISILFYTTFFFLVFFFYFLLIILLNLSSFFFYFSWVFYILFLFSILFLISLLFDVNYFKAFFAYSSVVNSISFFILLFSLI